jgi:hypothetical protein
MTVLQDQLNAACGEANKQRLRTLVHAYKDGTMASDDDLKLGLEVVRAQAT